MLLNEKDALRILNEGLKTSADYAEIYYQDITSHNYTRKYKKVYSISSSVSKGVGIRLLKNNQCVYGYTADLSLESLLKLASNLAFGFEGERVLTVDSLTYKKNERNINVIKIPHDKWTTEEKIAYLKKGEDAAFSYSSQVKDVMTRLFEEDEHVEIYNSDGKIFSDDRVRTRIMCGVVSSDGQQFQNDFEGPGVSKGLELLEEVDFVEIAKKVSKNACDMLLAKDGPSGEMPVVIGNGFGGTLFHEACGHPLEGCAISKNESPFAKKYNQKIASDLVTAIDDGTIENGWGSENIDDEGNKPTKNVLIKDGVLVSYMMDRFTSRRQGGDFKATGACRRESYKYTPTTRMTNTYIDNGKSTKEEIIASVKDGIYCVGFTGGQVDPATDQFIFTSSLTYLIKDGKITDMIKPVSLIGYGYDILPKITMVGNDLKRAPGVCGSSSGSCFVEVGQPTLLISSMLVGGKGEN